MGTGRRWPTWLPTGLRGGDRPSYGLRPSPSALNPPISYIHSTTGERIGHGIGRRVCPVLLAGSSQGPEAPFIP